MNIVRTDLYYINQLTVKSLVTGQRSPIVSHATIFVMRMIYSKVNFQPGIIIVSCILLKSQLLPVSKSVSSLCDNAPVITISPMHKTIVLISVNK